MKLDEFHVNPDFPCMQTCLCKTSGWFASNTDGVDVFGEIRIFRFYKFGVRNNNSGGPVYAIYDEVCLNSWKTYKEDLLSGNRPFYPMEVNEEFFMKNFIILETCPINFDGPQAVL